MASVRARRGVSLFFVIALSIGLSLTACRGAVRSSRKPVKPARVEVLPALGANQKIDADLALCFPKSLRGRVWNVTDYPFRVDLGLSLIHI